MCFLRTVSFAVLLLIGTGACKESLCKRASQRVMEISRAGAPSMDDPQIKQFTHLYSAAMEKKCIREQWTEKQLNCLVQTGVPSEPQEGLQAVAKCDIPGWKLERSKPEKVSQYTGDLIHYTSHHLNGTDTKHSAPFEEFIYRSGYILACNIFPPRHILNEELSVGGSSGGMGTGVTWEPFQLSLETYQEVMRKTLSSARDNRARQLKLDQSLDHHKTKLAWLSAACKKHRQAAQTSVP